MSGNSKRWGVWASRSFGPISGSVLIISKIWSITVRNSSLDLKLMAREPYSTRAREMAR